MYKFIIDSIKNTLYIYIFFFFIKLFRFYKQVNNQKKN